MIVVDASIAVKWFVAEIGHEAALVVLGSEEPIIAPDLVVAETMHALRKKLRAGDVTEEQYLRAGLELPSYFDQIVPSASVAEEAARLSIQLEHGFYDCVYLALSLTSGSSLVTADEVFEAKVAARGLSVVHGLSKARLKPESDRLAVPKETIENIGRLAKRVSETFEALRQAHTSDEPFRFLPVAIYSPAFESPAYLHLKQLTLALTQEERAQVIALGWLGRDYERGPFALLLENARRMFSGPPDKDVAYILSVMATVRAGYEKLLAPSEAQAKNE